MAHEQDGAAAVLRVGSAQQACDVGTAVGRGPQKGVQARALLQLGGNFAGAGHLPGRVGADGGDGDQGFGQVADGGEPVHRRKGGRTGD